MVESRSSENDGAVTRLNPSTLLDSTKLGLSQISIAEPGRMAFVSGQTATPRDRGEIPSELPEQALLVAANLAAALKALRASPHDIVMMRVHLVAATTDRFEQAWSPIRDMLDGALPSMTGIGVQALWTSALQLEVEMMVRLP